MAIKRTHTHTRAKKDGRTERITKSEKKKKKRIIIIIYLIAIDASDFRISTQFRNDCQSIGPID
jgi:hypothetical protein